MKKLIHIAWLLILLGVVSCESLEDTYDEYAGDGMVRYVGKCENLQVSPGWYRFKVKWKGNMDDAIYKVKLTYKGEDEAEPTVLLLDPQDILENESLIDSIYIENLKNTVYAVTLSNVTEDGMESIVEMTYARPYTEAHEDLRTFSRGILNFYRLGDKLAVFLDKDNEDILKMELKFTDTRGVQHPWNMKEKMQSAKEIEQWSRILDYAFLLPEEEDVEIDFNQPIFVERKGFLQGCIDTLSFTPDTLSMDEEVWSGGFTRYLTHRFGPDYTREDIESVREIELDYDMPTMKDLLYFPNLEKVILGKNRYIDPKFKNFTTPSYTDQYAGYLTLQFLKDTRPGFVVERYNGHYFNDDRLRSYLLGVFQKIDEDLITEKKSENMNEIPGIQPLDTTGWIVTCSDTTRNGYKINGAAYMLDGDKNTSFQPTYALSPSVVEVEFDMLEPRLVKGFKVVQPAAPAGMTAGSMGDYQKYLVNAIRVEFSDDGVNWHNATYENGGITIGNAPEEISFIEIPEKLQREVRYIRLSMSNKEVAVADGGLPLYSLRLADFIPY